MPFSYGKIHLYETDKKEVKTSLLKKLFNLLFRRHEHNFKKHYDKEKGTYVFRCTICGETIERAEYVHRERQ